jgi:hypothetical protein
MSLLATTPSKFGAQMYSEHAKGLKGAPPDSELEELSTVLKIEVFSALQMGFGTSKIPQGKQPFKI